MTWKRVVVGVDGSPGSTRALRWAGDEARQHGAELYVVMAYSLPPALLAVGHGVPPWRGAGEFRSDAESTLQQTLREAFGDEPGVTIRTEVVEGSPAEALIDTSKRSDLLVVGTRGHGGFAGMLLGSVSQHLTAHAACAVTVVR